MTSPFERPGGVCENPDVRSASRPLWVLTCLALFTACDTRVLVGDGPSLPPPSGDCNAATCPDGCCKGSVCARREALTPDQCGTGGAACIQCPGGEDAVCDLGQCTRSSCGVCAGCCFWGRCESGTSQLNCGRGGQECRHCGIHERCINGVCVADCDPSVCSGCCQDGRCETGNSDVACGTGAQPCDFCTGWTRCIAGSCQ